MAEEIFTLNGIKSIIKPTDNKFTYFKFDTPADIVGMTATCVGTSGTGTRKILEFERIPFTKEFVASEYEATFDDMSEVEQTTNWTAIRQNNRTLLQTALPNTVHIKSRLPSTIMSNYPQRYLKIKNFVIDSEEVGATATFDIEFYPFNNISYYITESGYVNQDRRGFNIEDTETGVTVTPYSRGYTCKSMIDTSTQLGAITSATLSGPMGFDIRVGSTTAVASLQLTLHRTTYYFYNDMDESISWIE